MNFEIDAISDERQEDYEERSSLDYDKDYGNDTNTDE